MFSSRLPWSLEPNPLTRLVQAKRAAGEKILDLTESNPTRAGLEYPAAEILAALADPRALRYHPDPAGLPEARLAVSSGYYRSRVPPERILLTASTSEAYALLFKLLADPGDEVLAPRPSYPLFEFLAALESVRIVQYPLIYDCAWQIDFEALRSAITPRTRAIVLVNPNNPTGSFLKTAELAELAALCAARNLAIVSDEVFADYAFGSGPNRVESLSQVGEALTFCLSGLSKVAALPQMKLGWIAVGGPPALASQAYERLELIADTYLSVASPVQWAAPRLLELSGAIRSQVANRTRANLDYLGESVARSSDWRMLHVEGGWYAVLQAPGIRTEEEWVLHLLHERNVLVQPGFFFDFEREAFLVLSLLTQPEVFREGVERLLSSTGRATS